MPASTRTTSSSRRRPGNDTRSSRAAAKTTRSKGASKRKLSWCFRDFEWFCSHLTTPDGRQYELEPHLKLILRFVFRAGMVELLVLLPKGNGKTTLFAALAVFHLLLTTNAQCFILAADVDQADEMYRAAQHFVESSKALRKRMYVRESTRRIRRRKDQGFIRVLASDKTKAKGKRHSYSPTLALIDELHAHENDAVYVAMRSAVFKRGGLCLNCSTAGHDQKSTLGELRTGMLKLDQHGGRVRRRMRVNAKGVAVKGRKDDRLTICEARSRRTAMLEWACEKDDDLSDPEVVKRANPASFVTVESLADALETPGIKPWDFARYRAGVWTIGFASWLPNGAWEKLAVRERFDQAPYKFVTSRRRLCIPAPPRLGIADGDEVYAAIDMGRYRDTAAVSAIAPRGNEDPAVWIPFVEESGGIDSPVPYGPIEDALRELDQLYRVLVIGFDPKYFDKSAEELKGEGLPMVQFSQSNERMCPAWANLRTAIIGADDEGKPQQQLRHDGDPILTAHILNGKLKELGEDLFKVTKQSATAPPIDCSQATAMAHQLAFFRKPKPKPFVEVLG